MTRLPQTLAAWGGTAFPAVLKAELEALPPEVLPLQAGLAHTSHVLEEEGFTVRLIAAREGPTHLHFRVGVFYTGLLAGCSCADDPTPVEGQPEYCEVEVTVDRESGVAAFVLAPDEA